ncbi:MAG: hypothetical protein R3233_03745 [Xanthomonadales bacterium]|nr:hypothetical protein [Xanthomonadales bacterium]
MTDTHTGVPATAQLPTTRQRLFVRYLTLTLVDLVVLNLFAEYWDLVTVDGFTISLIAAILLQVLLKLTLVLEHKVAAWFKARPGKTAKIMRWFVAWLILFGSKFVILEALNLALGDALQFHGAWHGVVAFIVVVVVMLLVEEILVRIVRRLGAEA